MLHDNYEDMSIYSLCITRQHSVIIKAVTSEVFWVLIHPYPEITWNVTSDYMMYIRKQLHLLQVFD